jgi:hypothetical protein|tara:strand:- start:110 stop:400 length:291 start_codon:yes stop_codon:yes gene_type:complete
VIANGLGPAWFPAAWRRWLTNLSARFFDEAGWREHDEGYDSGNPSRAACDFKFLAAMVRDASRVKTVLQMVACLFIAALLYILVRLFGWTTYKNGK